MCLRNPKNERATQAKIPFLFSDMYTYMPYVFLMCMRIVTYVLSGFCLSLLIDVYIHSLTYMYTAVRSKYWDFGLGWPFSGLDRCSRPWACFVELIHCSRPWAFVSEIERRFPFSAAQVSGPRGVQFRRLSGICLAFVRHLSGICPAMSLG